MTIKEMADERYPLCPKYYSEKEREREREKQRAYEQGAKDMLDKAYSWLHRNGLPELTGLAKFRKAMEEL